MKTQSKNKLPFIFSLFLLFILIFFLGFLAGKRYEERKVIAKKPKIAPIASQENKIVSEKKETPKKASKSKEEITFYQTLIDTEKSKKEEKRRVKNLSESNKGTQTKKAFTIQVGSFKKKSEALMLEAKLKEKGYDAYTELLALKGKNVWHRVRIGSYMSRKEAESSAKTIEIKEGLPTLVTIKSK